MATGGGTGIRLKALFSIKRRDGINGEGIAKGNPEPGKSERPVRRGPLLQKRRILLLARPAKPVCRFPSFYVSPSEHRGQIVARRQGDATPGRTRRTKRPSWIFSDEICNTIRRRGRPCGDGALSLRRMGLEVSRSVTSILFDSLQFTSIYYDLLRFTSI